MQKNIIDNHHDNVVYYILHIWYGLSNGCPNILACSNHASAIWKPGSMSVSQANVMLELHTTAKLDSLCTKAKKAIFRTTEFASQLWYVLD